MDIGLAIDLQENMKNSRIKIIIILLSAVVIFFAITFFQKWGFTLAEKATSDYSAKVKSVKNNPIKAAKICPSVIQSLQQGIPELQKNNAQAKILQSYKLIAECQIAYRQFYAAALNYQKLAEAEPQVARWHGLVAESYLNSGNAGEALRVSHLAVQLDPKNFKYRLLEARILAKLNITNRAILAYQEAIKIAPYDDYIATQNELNQLVMRNQQ